LNPNYQVVEVAARLLHWRVYWLSGWTKLCVRIYSSVSQELFRELLLYLCVRLHRIGTVVTWRRMRFKCGVSFSNKGQRTSI